MSAPGAAVLVVGEILLDVVVQLTVEGLPIATANLGGSAPTIARAVAASGLVTALAGRVGSDGAGSGLIAELRATPLTLAVQRDPQRPSGRFVVLLPPEAGDDPPRTLVEPGAAGTLRVGDVPAGLLAASRHLHLSGYLLVHGGARVAARRLLARARSGGLGISVQTPRPAALGRVGGERFLDLVAGIDLLVASAPEARLLTGVADPTDAAGLLLHAAREVVVTDGPRGAYRVGHDGHRAIHDRARVLGPAPPGMHGAGDAFTGGFLVPWLFGGSPRRCLAAGAAAAADRILAYRGPSLTRGPVR